MNNSNCNSELKQFEASLVDTTVVKTVRNLKKKHNGSAYHSLGDLDEEKASVHLNPNYDKENDIMGTQTITEGLAEEERNSQEEAEQNLPLRNNTHRANTIAPSVHDALYQRATRNRRQKTKKLPKFEIEFNFFENKHKGLITTFLQWFFTKSKETKDYLEKEALNGSYVTRNVLQNDHFILCFTGLLDTMLKAKEISKDLKNLSKPAFERIEAFILQKIYSQVLAEHIKRMKKEKYSLIEMEFERQRQELQYQFDNINFDC